MWHSCNRMRKTYTPEQKQAALDLYVEHGPAEAARRTKIPKPTITSWARRAGIPHSDAAANTREATKVAAARWEQRRAELADEIGVAAATALEQCRGHLDDPAGSARDAKDYALTMAILVDKAQLLSGGATSRAGVLDPDEVRRRAAQLDALAGERHLKAV